MRIFAAALMLLSLGGCAARVRRPPADDEFAPQRLIAHPFENHEEEMGPPPPGYVKIRGNAVPHWRPADMHQPGPDSGWTFVGPQPISGEYWSGDTDVAGRVVGIAVHPTNGQIAYVASASGGVWKTTNGGTNWTPLTDELSTLNHGAIALAP
ncbi:MAG: hypothetical protein HY269_09875, partial [Deltaproteobacteria bacterium]|nr:hypothetical protein [Deltaproteobacteria bacterium]